MLLSPKARYSQPAFLRFQHVFSKRVKKHGDAHMRTAQVQPL